MEQGFPEAPKDNTPKVMVPVNKLWAWLKMVFSTKKGKWGWR